MSARAESQPACACYRSLDPRELAAVAGSCSLSIEDVRQEAWLLCLRAVGGDSDYSARLGSVRQYIMGRLWGLALRWQVPVRLGYSEDPDREEPQVPGDAGWERTLIERSPYSADPEAADPVRLLVAREQDQEYRAAQSQLLDRRAASHGLTEGDRTFVELILGGTPIDQIAALYGLTPRAVRYRCARLEASFTRKEA